MHGLHLHLVIVDLLADPSQLIPNLLPFLLDGPFPIALLLGILVQHILHAEDLVLLFFCFQLNLLVLLCLSDNFGSLYQAFLLFICLLLGDDRN